METKEDSTPTAVEKETVLYQQAKSQISGMYKKDVSTQTAEEDTAGSVQAIEAQTSANLMKKGGNQTEIVLAVAATVESSKKQTKNPSSKKKDSSYSSKSTVKHGVDVSVEGKKDSTEISSTGSKTAMDDNDSINRDAFGEEESGDTKSTRRETAVDEEERHESSMSNDETDSCISLSSAAFNLESRLEDFTPETRNAIPVAAKFPGASHTPDCKLNRFLSPDETQALIQLQNEIGKFSFYICGNGKVVIHPEDELALKNHGLLKFRFSNIVGESGRVSEIIFKDSSFKGTFCTHRIGAKVVADGRQTTAGMYVSHNGVLYLISSAHNYVFSESGYDGSEQKKLLLLDEGRSFIDVAGEKVPLRPLYCVFSRMCDLKDKGRRIMHLVDISIGLAPVCTSHMEKGRTQFCASISEGQDSCRDCGETVEDCTESRHRKDNNPCQFKIARFYDFGGPMCCGAENSEDQLRRFYDEKLLNEGGALVRCRPCDQSVVAGRVLSFDNAVTFRIDEQRTITATNVLLITSVKRQVIPQLGDSGSIWVLDGTDDAVAITVGLGEAPDGGLLWAAAPLKPLLEAVCCTFPKVFSDVSTIKPACHVIARPTTTPGNEAATMATPLSPPSSAASLVGLVTQGDPGYVTASSRSLSVSFIEETQSLAVVTEALPAPNSQETN